MSHANRDELDSVIGKDVQFACRARRIMQPQRIALFARSVQEAVYSRLPGDATPEDPQFKELLKAQLTLLKQSFDTLPKRLANEKASAQAANPCLEESEAAGITASEAGSQPEFKSFDEKLAEQREVLKSLVTKDCLQLGLLTPERVKEICEHLAGKTPQQAEQAIITEVRNNLHKQVRAYIRKNKGGPWGSVKLQNELRIEIQSTDTLRRVLSLTRQLLRERKQWEKNNSGGIRGLIKRKLKLS